ncbi:MAG: endonuclease V [Actinoplanes sp.]
MPSFRVPTFRVPSDVADAESIQDELRKHLIVPSSPIEEPRTAVGVDVTYEVNSDRAMAAAVGRLAAPPPLIVCDGYGLAHPRRFGLACHLGLLLDVPAFGVAKTPFIGEAADPDRDRGEFTDLTDNGEVIGRAVRTQSNVKPVFVSAGHRIGLADSTTLAVRLSSRYRIPEPTRQADILSRRALRELAGNG